MSGKTKNASPQQIVRRFLFLRSFLRKNESWYFLLLCFICSTYEYFSTHLTKSYPKPFLIKKITFDGNDHVQDVLLLKASGLKYRTNIFIPDLREVKAKLEQISWVKSAVVQRKFPDEIRVRISERIPIAILQSKHHLYLIDSDGVVIEHKGIGNFSGLPIVIGEGAEKETNSLLQCLNKFPKIRNQLVFAIRVGKRRWDIKVNRGIIIKLPEQGMLQALQILEEISDSNGFFNEDIFSIDLRMLDRVVVTKKQENSKR